MRHGKRGIFRRIINALVLIITILVCAGFMISALSSYISPERFKYAPLCVMTFQFWWAAVLVLLVVELIWWRRTALIPLVSLLICIQQVLNFSPIHLPKGKMDESQRERSFTLMTYNVMQFVNQDKYSIRSVNEQLDYILSESPDLVCIEESRCLVPTSGNNITPEQLAELNDMYPYIFIKSENLTFLSKYEAEVIPIDFPKEDFSSGDIGAWRVHIDGRIVNVFVVHLLSFGLDSDEKSLFKELTTPESANRKELKEAKTELLPKVTTASIERTAQIMLLEKYIKKYGGENVIVCGDFNDPVGSYGLTQLCEDSDLKQAYREVGFGPMVTYNANHMLFRIDHVLYRGNLKPWSLTRGKLKASDHYPLNATFVFDE